MKRLAVATVIPLFVGFLCALGVFVLEILGVGYEPGRFDKLGSPIRDR